MNQRISELPESYRRALELKQAGTDDASIAAALEIAVEAVPVMLAVADAKLARLGSSGAAEPGAGSAPSLTHKAKGQGNDV